MKGYTGKILCVDLSEKTTEIKSIPDDVYEKVLSGLGLGAYYLYNNIPKGADPLGEDNILGFVSGLLTGSGSFMTGRWLAVCKSPLTGGFGDANCGGYFSPKIKQCGFDGIFFRGISKEPVYLYCDNKVAELRDASHVWGKDATEAEEILIKENTVKIKPAVAVIGLAGEKLSLISGICNDGGRIAARSGVGAVMGSKRLKAVVLAGTKQIKCEDLNAVKEINKAFAKKVRASNVPSLVNGNILGPFGAVMGRMKYSLPMDGAMSIMFLKRWGTPFNTPMGLRNGDAPVKNWAGSSKDIKGKFLKQYNPDSICKREYKKYHCYSCPVGCGGVLKIDDVGNREYAHTHKPEYETLNAFGALLMNDDINTLLYINELLNRAGMDSISAGNTIAYAIECYENGLITKEDTDGLELKWGNAEAILALVKKMISREGFGDVLADGVKKAIERLGEKTTVYGMHIGGQEPGMHDARMDPELGVHYVADPTPGKHTTGARTYYNYMSLHLICSWVPRAVPEKKDNEYTATEDDAIKGVAVACYKMLLDGAGGCYYAMIMGSNNWNIVDYLNAVTGWNKPGDHYMEIGRRIQTIRQMFNVREGVNISKWKLPDRMAGSPPLSEGPLKNRTLPIKEMVSQHWKLFGYDEKTGVPTSDTIEQLGLKDLLSIQGGVGNEG